MKFSLNLCFHINSGKIIYNRIISGETEWRRLRRVGMVLDSLEPFPINSETKAEKARNTWMIWPSCGELLIKLQGTR